MKINNENIDELMFQLLEGDIQGEERALLLDAINSDKNYRLQWQAWQKTILNPNEELLVMNTGKLLKKERKFIMPWMKYCAAASVILVAGLSTYYVMNKQGNAEVVKVDNNKPKNPKLEIIKVPSVDPVNKHLMDNDSTIPFKQKIQMMADKNKTILPARNEQSHPKAEEMEQVIIVKQDELKQIPESKIQEPLKNADPIFIADKTSTNDHIITSVYTESKPKNKVSTFNQVIGEKKNLLARIFSKPKFTVVNDSNSLRKSKLIIENKEYKIIAGF